MASDQPPNSSNVRPSLNNNPGSPSSAYTSFEHYLNLEAASLPPPVQVLSSQQRQQQSQASRRMSLSNRERAAQLDEILGRGPPSPSTAVSLSPRLSRTSVPRPTIVSGSGTRPSNTPMLSSSSSSFHVRDESSAGGSFAPNGFTPRIIRAPSTSASGAAGGVGAASSSQNPSNHGISTSPQFARSLPRSPVSSSGPGPRIIPWSALSRAASSSNAPSPAPHISSPAPPPSFPRPSYLDNSALRHLLHSEQPPTLPPNRYRFDGSTTESLSNSSLSSQRKRAPVNIDSDDDDTDVSNDGRDSPSVPRLSNTPTYMRLPTRWSENDRNTALTITGGGRELIFHGLEGKESAAAARTNEYIPPACGIYYYEVHIVDKGSKGYISIGFSARDVRLTRLPGWESQSWGYHGDDGQVFTGGTELPFGKKFTTGDIIGCGIDFTTHRAFYTKGGVFINSVFNDVGAKAEIFPSVGLRSQGEAIRANFGQEPFKFDINAYVQQERTRVWRAIQTTPIDVVEDRFQLPIGAKLPSLEVGVVNKATEPPQRALKTMNELIYAYLVHHGYSNTAREFRGNPNSQLKSAKEKGKITSMSNEQSMDLDLTSPEELGAASSSQLSSDRAVEVEEDKEDLAVESRQHVVRAVLSGDIDTAIEETRSKYPDVLKMQDGLILFKLKCRKFVELILEVAEAYRKKSGESEAEVENAVLPSSATTITSPPPISTANAGTADGREFASPLWTSPTTTNGTVSSGVFDMDMEVDGDVLPTEKSQTNGHSGPDVPPYFSHNSSTLPPSGPESSSLSHPHTESTSYQALFERARSYGQELSSTYKDDRRAIVQNEIKRASSLIAFADPLHSTREEAVSVAGQGARNELAGELNRAILESMGLPTTPALERLYCQTAATVTSLGCLGVGAAAFTDTRREFLED